ncbi:unnamed protein product [Amoebophrya sp. A25]|nr:unnamed protein product [Amoebophrya sp. A25]|eukprot:GSA25T00018131001.1
MPSSANSATTAMDSFATLSANAGQMATTMWAKVAEALGTANSSLKVQYQGFQRAYPESGLPAWEVTQVLAATTVSVSTLLFLSCRSGAKAAHSASGNKSKNANKKKNKALGTGGGSATGGSSTGQSNTSTTSKKTTPQQAETTNLQSTSPEKAPAAAGNGHVVTSVKEEATVPKAAVKSNVKTASPAYAETALNVHLSYQAKAPVAAVAKTVLNTPVKQLIKLKKQELAELRQKETLNNRERRLLKKLEPEIEALAACEVNKQGMCKFPEKFLPATAEQDGGSGSKKKADDSEDDESPKKRTTANGTTKQANGNDGNKKASNKNATANGDAGGGPMNARVIDLQRQHGISMEMAANAMIAQSLAADTSPDAGAEFTEVAGSKKKKKKVDDGWETVQRKGKK